MKKSLSSILTASVFSIAIGASEPTEAATATSTIIVSATVISFCLISAAPLTFGNYTSAQLDATAVLSASCTLGTPYTISLDQGGGTGATVAARHMNGTVAGSTLNYSIFSDTTRLAIWGNVVGTNTTASTGTGVVQTFTAYGRIPAAQLSAPGIYTDTVNVTLTY
jgi:spore coat protein U-like protein